VTLQFGQTLGLLHEPHVSSDLADPPTAPWELRPSPPVLQLELSHPSIPLTGTLRISQTSCQLTFPDSTICENLRSGTRFSPITTSLTMPYLPGHLIDLAFCSGVALAFCGAIKSLVLTDENISSCISHRLAIQNFTVEWCTLDNS